MRERQLAVGRNRQVQDSALAAASLEDVLEHRCTCPNPRYNAGPDQKRDNVEIILGKARPLQVTSPRACHEL